MLIGSRLHHVALRGCLIAALSLVAVSANAQKQPDQETKTSQPAPAVEQSADPPGAVALPERKQPVEPDWSKPNCDSPQQHNEADLCQQIRMSDSAKDALKLNAWQLAVAVATLLGLAFTVYYSRQTAQAAIAAASAAMKSNEISHGNAVAERRAWLELIEVGLPYHVVNVADDNIGIVVAGTAKNHGSSPATKIKFNIKMMAIGGDYDAKDILKQFRAETHGAGDDTCFPDQPTKTNAGIFIPRNLIDAAAARRKRDDTPIPMFVFINVTYYVLGDDERHETGAVYRVPGFDAATAVRGKVATVLRPAGDQFPGWAT
jgi:hypothetical protein